MVLGWPLMPYGGSTGSQGSAQYTLSGIIVLCGSAPVPYEGLYIEALRPQGAVQWSQVGSMGS